MSNAIAIEPIVKKLTTLKRNDQLGGNPELEDIVDKMAAINTVFKGDQFSISSTGIEHLQSVSLAPPPVAWIWSWTRPF